MNMRGQRAMLWAAACVLLYALASCRRVGPLIMDAPQTGTERPSAPAVVRYFFDRTESMKGFTADGGEAGYGKALRALWGVKPSGAEEEFYEYGELGIAQYDKAGAANRVKGRVLRPEFYGLESSFWARPNLKSDSERTKIAETRDGGPLYGVLNFLGALEPDGLYVFVTDLYEQQNYGAHPVQSLFSGIFEAGLAGALFAVESTFKGVVHSVSSTDDKASIQVPNGAATFFICIAGGNAEVFEFTMAFANDLKANDINYHSSVFLTRPVGAIEPRISNPRPGNNREFSDAKNALVSMNIDRENTRAQAYRLLMFDSSRWVAGLPLPHINFDNFSYSSNFSLFYDDGKRDKKNDNAGVWGPADSGNITAKSQRGSRNNPLFFIVETKNKSLSAGHYKLDYEIIPEAKPAPDWVRNLNAPDISALRESARSGAENGGGIKVLELLNVYRKIAEAYNKTNPRIHADRLDLTKR
jgi:hypothetical protein